MGSLELLSYFWSLNTIPVVKIWNFDFGHLTYPPIKDAIIIFIAKVAIIIITASGLYSNFCPSLGTHAYIGTWSLKSYLFWHTSSVYVPIYQCQSAYFVTVWEKLTITINLSIPSSNTHGWYKSTYFSKLGKHNSGGDSSQHTFGWSNSVIPMGDTSQHTFQNQENTKVVVIQVSIVLD